MIMYYLIIEMNKNLYIFVDIINNNVIISSPSEDIYSRKSPCVNIESDKYVFFYNDCIYQVFSNLCFAKIKHNKTQNIVIAGIERIDQNAFIKASQVIDRYKLFEESSFYKESNKNINFEYNLNKSDIDLVHRFFPVTKELAESKLNDFDKMKYILFWISDQVKHNGQNDLPQKRDAITLFKYAKLNDFTLNCRGLAVLLCELCLAIGFKARYIVCSQKEEKYTDCHVVTICYSDEIKKWIYLDPCYKMYLFNQKNEILSLQEFKKSILENSEISINQEANSSGKQLNFEIFKESMIKKMYKYASPLKIYISMDEDRDNNLCYLVPDENSYMSLNCTSNEYGFWA